MASPISPRLLKGGIVTLDPTTGIPTRSIVLQYNPDTLTRKLQPQLSFAQRCQQQNRRQYVKNVCWVHSIPPRRNVIAVG